MNRSFKIALLAVAGVSSLVHAEGQSMGSLTPRAAEIARLADKNLLLGIIQTGGQLVAVGDRGTILLSADGVKWEQMPVPVNATLTAVSFAADGKNGWAVGHDLTILHTTDAGHTWALQNFQPKDSKPVLGILALDAEHAYAVGAYGTFLGTSDGGTTWAPVAAPALLQDGPHLNALVRLGNGDLFLVGENGLLGLWDGGGWRRLKLPYEGSLFGVLPRGERGALVYGLRGNAFVTSDVRSGQWTRLDTRTVQSLFGGAALQNGESVIVGSDGAVLVVGADNKVRRGASAAGKNESAASYAAALPWKDQLLVVSEQGVAHLADPVK